MSKINREIIQLISRHSNWSEKGISKALVDNVYADKTSWLGFLSWLFLGLGTAFTTAGIVFFFAYNWVDLHKFIKLGSIEGLIVVASLWALFARRKPFVSKLMLTTASVLAGVLYAVFGQVYQTGANAYDFFLGWTLSVTLWAIVSHFFPLWIIYIALINITLVLYVQQVAFNFYWNDMFPFALLMGVNALFLVLFVGLPTLTRIKKAPQWFVNILGLTVVGFATFGITNGIFEDKLPSIYVLLISTLLLYGLGVWYGLKTRGLFYLSIIPFSVVTIISAFLLHLSDDAGMLLTIGLFIIISITFLIKLLTKLQKKWAR